MSSITSGSTKQYGDSRKLAARARLNSEYTIAEIGWFEWVAQNLPIKEADRILDIGCGPGWFWQAVAQQLPAGISLALADLSDGMVEEAMDRCRPLPFAEVNGRRADAVSLPFADHTFDGVIGMHMLYHVTDQEKAIGEMYRVLRPGGFLAVTTNGIGNMRQLYELTTVFGSPPYDPAGAAFGYEAAERKMRKIFGNVNRMDYPARMRVTEPQDVFMALTSYPPGDEADDAQLASFRDAIQQAFSVADGVLEVAKETGLFVSRKPD